MNEYNKKCFSCRNCAIFRMTIKDKGYDERFNPVESEYSKLYPYCVASKSIIKDTGIANICSDYEEGNNKITVKVEQ